MSLRIQNYAKNFSVWLTEIYTHFSVMPNTYFWNLLLMPLLKSNKSNDSTRKIIKAAFPFLKCSFNNHIQKQWFFKCIILKSAQSPLPESNPPFCTLHMWTGFTGTDERSPLMALNCASDLDSAISISSENRDSGTDPAHFKWITAD